MCHSEQVSIVNASKNLPRVQSETSLTEGTPELEPVLAALRLLGQVRYSRDPRLGGSEGSGSPVGYSAKQKATRTSHPKQAVRPLQGNNASIEDA